MADEDVMAKALGMPAPGEKQRDAQGRFASQKPEAPAQQQQAPADGTQAKPSETQQAADEAAQQYKWDELKGIKLKVPFKTGDKEWEEEIPLEELRNRGMMHADYMARRREMDTQIKTEQTKAQQAVEKERQTYLTSLKTLHQTILQASAPELANVDWTKLASDNPAEYVRLSNRAQQVNAALERVKFEQEKVTRQQATERDQRLATAVSESKQKLLEAIPSWNEQLYQGLMKRAVDTYGFRPNDVDQIWDHRIMQLLHDADQFRRLKEEKPAADKKVENAPPVLKPGSQKPRVNVQEQGFKNAQERLRKNGNDIDAGTEVMAAFLTKK